MGVTTSKFLLWGTVVNLARSKDTAPDEKEIEEMEQVSSDTHDRAPLYLSSLLRCGVLLIHLTVSQYCI